MWTQGKQGAGKPSFKEMGIKGTRKKEGLSQPRKEGKHQEGEQKYRSMQKLASPIFLKSLSRRCSTQYHPSDSSWL